MLVELLAPTTLHSDFRLVAATNRDLGQAMGDGRFRQDLFYRLNVVRIDVPPLRARRSDIPELAEHFLHRHRAGRTDGPSGFSDDAMRALLLHDYPGNVREQENLIQRAVVLARGPFVTAEDLPGLAGGASGGGGDARLADLVSLPISATRSGESQSDQAHGRRWLLQCVVWALNNTADFAARGLQVAA